MNDIYIHTIIAQPGNGPIHAAGNTAADFAEETREAAAFSPARETNPVASQALALMALLLNRVSTSQRQKLGLFIGTRFGCLEDDRIFQKSRIADGGKYTSPAAFRRTLPSTLPAELSIAFGIQGPLITFADSSAPTMIAIIRAYHWIATGAITAAVAGSFDFLLTGNTTSPATSPTYHTLLCLMASRETFPELNTWATITKASIEANRQSTDQTEAIPEVTDFTEIRTAIGASNDTTLNLHRQSGTHNMCHLEMRITHQ